jgi:TolB protein
MRILRIVIVLSILAVPKILYSKVYLDVYATGMKKMVIGVPYFKGEGISRLRVDIPELLQKDLEFSGFFICAPWSLIDRELQDEGIERNEISFNKWKSIGIETLLKGKVKENGEEIVTEIYLYDTSSASLELAKRYRTKKDALRSLVHRIADDIIEAVTGAKGILSSKLVFVAGPKGATDIYISSIDGLELRKITDFKSITVIPSLSPDGKYLSYTSYREGKPNLYVLDVEKKSYVYVDRDEGMKVGREWLDRKTLLYSHTSGKYSSIVKLDVESKTRKVILRKEGIITSPSPSPDGKTIVFASDMHGTPQIFSMDMTSGEIKRLTYNGKYNVSPSYSPKGDLIAFVSKIEGALEICVMDPKGSKVRMLTNSGEINDSPSFSPCGRYIVFSSQKGGKTRINLMFVNGENRRSLSITGQNEMQPRFTK